MLKGKRVLQVLVENSSSVSDLADVVGAALIEQGAEVVNLYLTNQTGALSTKSSHYLDYHSRHWRGFRRFLTQRKVLDWVKAQGADLIIAHRHKPIDVAHFLSKKSGIPVLGVVHGLGVYNTPARQLLLRRVVKDGVKIVGCSQAVTDSLSDILGSREGLYTIDNGVDVDRIAEEQFDRAAARQALGIAESAFVFGNVARLVPVKGQIYLIQAMAQLVKQHPNSHCVIVGEGSERTQLEASIRELGLENHVSLVGEKSLAWRYMKAFDVFVFPSISEGMGLALLEAMCGSVPVICSDIPAPAKVLNGRGVLVPIRDVPALSRAMRDYCGMGADELREQGESVHQRVREYYNLQRYKREFSELALEICQ